MRLSIPAGLLLTAVGLAACGSTDTAAGPAAEPTIVAAFAPLAYAAQQVAGDAVRVVDLTPPGVEPHDLELTASQVAEIADASLVVSVPGFQPAVDDAVAQQAADRSIDATDGVALLGNDPHVWLDPASMATLGQAIAERLAADDPAQADDYRSRANDLAVRMQSLSAEFREGLAQCTSRTMVVSHEAFGYLAAANGMTQVGISGLSPEAEPSPARMAEVADVVREHGISTIYYETLVDPKVAQTIADETGATTAVLDPIEGLAEGTTYEEVMRANLATLRAGQQCT